MNLSLRQDAESTLRGLGPLNAEFAGRRLLLTGAAGFLGTHWIYYLGVLNESGLLASPCRVYAYDNFSRGTPASLSPWQGQPWLSVHSADVTEKIEYPAVDYVVHAATIASPTFYRRFPIETMDANVIGLRRLLDGAVGSKLKSLLFYSSSEIYGDPDPAHIPTDEEYRGYVSCTGPRACYDESKRYGETLCVNFRQVHGVPVKIARPFNNYGPGLAITDRRVLPDFFRDVLAGRDIEILSDGRATRTFCYVSDALEGYVRILLSDHQGEAFNIGTERPEISMRELAELVVRVTGSKNQVRLKQSEDAQYLTDCPQRRCPDISKARRLLGFEPKVGLEEGLTRAFQYYRAISSPENLS